MMATTSDTWLTPTPDDLPWLWVDGRIAPSGEPSLRASDLGLLRGDGCFETMLVRARQVLALDAHLSRLTSSLVGLAIIEASAGEPLGSDLHRAIDALIAASDRLSLAHEAVVRITVTAQTRLIQLLPMTARQRVRRQGLRLWTLPEVRHESLVHRHKTLAWTANAAWSRLHPSSSDLAFEGLWLGANGHVLEGTSSNIFIIEGNAANPRIRTPPTSRPILSGTARARAIEAARALGLTVAESDFTQAELIAAPEAFVTSATLPVAPVLAVDGHPKQATCSEGATFCERLSSLMGAA